MLKLYLFSHKVCSRTFIINSSSTCYDKVASSCSHWEHTYSLAFLCKIKLRGTNTSRSSFSSQAPRAQYFPQTALRCRQTCLKLPNPPTTRLRRGQNQHRCQEPRSTAHTSSCTGTHQGDGESARIPHKREMSPRENLKASLSYFCSVPRSKKCVR